MMHRGRSTWLSTWAAQVARHRGGKRARVVLKRRFRIILHRMWVGRIKRRQKIAKLKKGKRKAEIWEYGAASSKPFTPPHSPERGQASHLFSAGPLSPLEVQVVDPAQPKAKILNQTLEPWPFDPSPVCVLPDLGDVLTDWRRVPTVFTKTRDRLLTTEMSRRFCQMSISRSMERW